MPVDYVDQWIKRHPDHKQAEHDLHRAIDTWNPDPKAYMNSIRAAERHLSETHMRLREEFVSRSR
jgi:hypothetical protein